MDEMVSRVGSRNRPGATRALMQSWEQHLVNAVFICGAQCEELCCAALKGPKKPETVCKPLQCAPYTFLLHRNELSHVERMVSGRLTLQICKRCTIRQWVQSLALLTAILLGRALGLHPTCYKHGHSP